MSILDLDRGILERCLANQGSAWEDFVDRFSPLMLHVVQYTAHSRGLRLRADERDDILAEIFLEVLRNDRAVLRRFREQSSLSTYLAVIGRRVAVRELLKSKPLQAAPSNALPRQERQAERTDLEELERLISRLDEAESKAVRMFHLEGKTYEEVGKATGVQKNSVGPLLSRAREKMREQAEQGLH